MNCSLCNGTGQATAVVKHVYTNLPKTESVPCLCFLSRTVSSEYRLLSYLGDQYVDPKNMDSRLAVNFDDPAAIPNLKLYGNADAVYLQIKALLMKHRFDNARIFLTKAINIVHDFHVQQSDGDAPQHISFLTTYSLLIITLGTLEKNEALAPCLAQVITNRLEAKKPTWVYIPPVSAAPGGTMTTQENTPDVLRLLEDFQRVEIGTCTATGQKSVDMSSAEFSVSSK